TFSNEFGEVVEATVQKAPDTGLQRHFVFDADAINGNAPLQNWQKFWLVVSAYGYNEIGVPKILESPLVSIEVVPQGVEGGILPSSNSGDLIAYFANADSLENADHTQGTSDGQLEIEVVDPINVTDSNYEITFEVDDSTGAIGWNVTSGSEVKVSGWDNQDAADAGNFPLVDGVIVRMMGPPEGINEVDRSVDPPGGERWVSGTDWGGSHLFGGLDIGANFFGSTVSLTDYVTVDVRFTSDSTSMSEATGWSRAYTYRRDLGYAAQAL
ncbi:unnamed protein product, partial [marine sediment metagenome]